MRVVPVALLGAVAALSGCISGAFFPAEVPQASLADGWTKDAESSRGGETGVPPLVVAKYQVNVYTFRNLGGALYVISVSDVPIVDEQAEIQKQLQPRLDELGIALAERTSGTGAVGGVDVPFKVFDAQKTISVGGASNTVKGLAVDLRYTCPANKEAVRAFGYAVTDTGLIGVGGGRGAWEQLAGGADLGQLGGMVTQVRCSA